MTSRPFTPARRPCTEWRASANCRKIACACGSSSSPHGVRRTERPSRSNNGAPISDSSFRICCQSEGCHALFLRGSRKTSHARHRAEIPQLMDFHIHRYNLSETDRRVYLTIALLAVTSREESTTLNTNKISRTSQERGATDAAAGSRNGALNSFASPAARVQKVVSITQHVAPGTRVRNNGQPLNPLEAA
jgi:hypothetical protein